MEVESTPFHLLDVSASDKGWATAQMMREQPDLLASYIPFLGKVPMKLLQELEAMARKKMKGPDLRIGPIAELIGLKNVIDQLGLKRIIEEAGAKRVVNELGAEKVVHELGTERLIDIAFRHLSESERSEMKRRLKSKPH